MATCCSMSFENNIGFISPTSSRTLHYSPLLSQLVLRASRVGLISSLPAGGWAGLALNIPQSVRRCDHAVGSWLFILHLGPPCIDRWSEPVYSDLRTCRLDSFERRWVHFFECQGIQVENTYCLHLMDQR